MAGNGGRPRRGADEALAAALAGGATVRDAAAAVGIGERTAHRRLADPRFVERVAELRKAMVDAALGKMVDAMTAAADALRALLNAESDTIKLGAARAVLDMGIRLRDAADHEERLARLENLGEWVKGRGVANAERNGSATNRAAS